MPYLLIWRFLNLQVLSEKVNYRGFPGKWRLMVRIEGKHRQHALTDRNKYSIEINNFGNGVGDDMDDLLIEYSING